MSASGLAEGSWIACAIAGSLLARPLLQWGWSLDRVRLREWSQLGTCYLFPLALLLSLGALWRLYTPTYATILALGSLLVLAGETWSRWRSTGRARLETADFTVSVLLGAVLLTELWVALGALGWGPSRFPGAAAFAVGGRAAPVYAAAARHSNPQVRAEALSEMFEWGFFPPEVLRHAADDPDPMVRREAAGGMNRSKNATFVADLGALLIDPDAGIRTTAQTGIEQYQSPLAVPGILAALVQEKQPIQMTPLGKILSKLGPGTAEALRESLNDPKTSIRGVAAEVLVGMPNGDAAVCLAQALTDQAPQVRAGALRGAAAFAEEYRIHHAMHIPDPEHGLKTDTGTNNPLEQKPPDLARIVTQTISALRDQAPEVRVEAAKALKHAAARRVIWGGKAIDTADVKNGFPAVPYTAANYALRIACRDPKQEVRWAALGALFDVGDASSTPTLVKMAGSTDANARRMALLILQQIKDRSGIPALLALDRTLKMNKGRCDVCETLYDLGLRTGFLHSFIYYGEKPGEVFFYQANGPSRGKKDSP